LKVRKDNAEIWLSYALCQKELGRASNSLAALNSAFSCESSAQLKAKILLERIRLNLHGKKLKDCKKDLAKLEELDGESSDLHYYKGLVQLSERNKKGGLLSF
jgi:hypothetical protein